jgi:toxin ParE1/3/4
VKLFIQEVAREDVLEQVGWYSDKQLYDIADRFKFASSGAISAVMQTPDAGAPKAVSNPQLVGLRTWPLRGFDDFRVYYLLRSDLLIVVRILHGKRDIGKILQGQTLEDPGFH